MIREVTKVVIEGTISSAEVRNLLIPSTEVRKANLITETRSFADGFCIDFANGATFIVDVSFPSKHGNAGQKAMWQVLKVRELLAKQSGAVLVDEINKILGEQ